MDFFKILFFAKSLLLTPDVISIDDQLSLSLNPPVSAITAGANIEINVSKLSDELGVNGLGIQGSREFLNKLLPAGSVNAELLNGDRIVALNHMGFALENNGAKLILTATDGVPTGIDFNTLKITTSVPLKNVTITWKNHTK